MNSSSTRNYQITHEGDICVDLLLFECLM
jgi:hypothetical protein